MSVYIAANTAAITNKIERHANANVRILFVGFAIKPQYYSKVFAKQRQFVINSHKDRSEFASSTNIWLIFHIFATSSGIGRRLFVNKPLYISKLFARYSRDSRKDRTGEGKQIYLCGYSANAANNLRIQRETRDVVTNALRTARITREHTAKTAKNGIRRLSLYFLDMFKKFKLRALGGRSFAAKSCERCVCSANFLRMLRSRDDELRSAAIF